MAIDTYVNIAELKKAGLTEKQAVVIVEQQKRAIESDYTIATKLDIEKIRSEIKDSREQTIKWIVGLFFAQVAINLTILGIFYAILY